MLTEHVKKEFLLSIICRVIRKMSLMCPDLSRAFSFWFVATQRSRKNFLLMPFVLELDAIALLDANAECQQKAIVPFLMLMLVVKVLEKM